MVVAMGKIKDMVNNNRVIMILLKGQRSSVEQPVFRIGGMGAEWVVGGIVSRMGIAVF